MKPQPRKTVESKKAAPRSRVTMWVPDDVIAAYKKRAEATDSKYQTLMNRALKEDIQKPDQEKITQGLLERIELLERKLKVKR